MQPCTLFACTVSIVTARAVWEGVVSNGIPQTVPLLCGGAGRQHSAEEKGKLHYNVLRELFLEKYQDYYYASSQEWSLNCRLFSPDWLV